jgi:hypothetical protein
MDEVTEAVNYVESCQVIFTVPHMEELRHKWVVAFPCTMNLILHSKDQDNVE